MSKQSQKTAERLAMAISRAVAMHGPGSFGFGELERFHGGPDALDAMRLARRHAPALDAALKLHSLIVTRHSSGGVVVAMVQP